MRWRSLSVFLSLFVATGEAAHAAEPVLADVPAARAREPAAVRHEPRVAVMAMILAARDGGLGLGAAGDVTPWLRIGGGVGGFALGTVGTRWMAATVGARVLETGPETGFRLRLLPTAGVARLTAHDSQSDGPGPSSRETLAATTTVELDATRFGPAPALTLRVAGGALWALSQSRTGEGGSTFSRGYSAGWLLSLGAGVAF